MICKNCGSEITERTAFCTECGAPLIWEDEAPNNAPAAPEAPVYAAPAAPAYTAQQPYAPAYQQPAAPAYAAAPAYVPQPAPEKPKGKGGKIALIVTTVILALALVGAGVFGYILYNQKTDEINTLQAEKTALEEQLGQADADKGTLADDYNDLSAKYDAVCGERDTLSAQYDELSKDYTALSEDYDALSASYDEILPEYDFFTDFAVICSDQNKYYHTYECEDWDRSAFWIYNLDAAKGKEFTPCPKCHAGEQ